MHNIEEVSDVLAAFKAAIPLATLVSPVHRRAFRSVLKEARMLVGICASRRPTGVELGCVWQTLRGLPDVEDFIGMRSDILDAAGELRNMEPSWVQPEIPEAAVDMLAALIEAAQHVVFALCRPARGGGFASPNAQQQERHLREAREGIDRAWAKAMDLHLV